jgi:hypothetical protein
VARYEDILADPHTELARLFAWMQLESSPQQLSDWISRNAFDRIDSRSRGPSSFWRAASPGGWRDNLRHDEQQALQKILGPKLSELKYSP